MSLVHPTRADGRLHAPVRPLFNDLSVGGGPLFKGEDSTTSEEEHSTKEEIPSDIHSYRSGSALPVLIFHLESGGKYDYVRGSLREATLGEVQGQYDALSYVWGPEHP